MSFRRSKVGRYVPVAVAGLVLGLAGAANAVGEHWVAAWASALQPIPELASPPPLYKTPDLADRTLREIVYPSVSGNQVRVRISNAYGRTPLALGSVRIARSAGGAAVREAMSVDLSFGGRRDLIGAGRGARQRSGVVERRSRGAVRDQPLRARRAEDDGLAPRLEPDQLCVGARRSHRRRQR